MFHELADVISQTPDLSNIRIEKGGEKKNQGVRAKWKKRNRIIIHLVMFGQSFRPQQPS